MSHHPDIKLLPKEYKDEVADVTAESLGLRLLTGQQDDSWYIVGPDGKYKGGWKEREIAEGNLDYDVDRAKLRILCKRHGTCEKTTYQGRGPSIKCNRPAVGKARDMGRDKLMCKQHLAGAQRSAKKQAEGDREFADAQDRAKDADKRIAKVARRLGISAKQEYNAMAKHGYTGKAVVSLDHLERIAEELGK